MGKAKKQDLAKQLRKKWFLLDFLKLIAWPTFVLFLRTKKYYESETSTTKIKGPAVIISNHPSIWEPPVILHTFFRRRVFFLIHKTVYHRNRFMAWIYKKAGCITIDKEDFDINFFFEITQRLNEGEIVTIFPEGTFSDADAILPFKSGAIMATLHAGVPIIPVYVKGERNLFPRKKIMIGDPINPLKYTNNTMPSIKEIEAFSDMLRNKVWEFKQRLDSLDKSNVELPCQTAEKNK